MLEINHCLTFYMRENGGESAATLKSVTKARKKVLFRGGGIIIILDIASTETDFEYQYAGKSFHRKLVSSKSQLSEFKER